MNSASFARVQDVAPQPVRLVLPPAVSANKYWRPVRIGKHITIVPTTEAKAYRSEVALLAKQAGAKPVRGRVALTVRMYPGRPQDWAKRAAKDPDGWDDTVRSIDLDNALKVLLDALKNVAFDDDSWVRRFDAERCEPDEHGARVVVEVTPIVREAVAPELFGSAM
jgi:crossover junction endodeoxyribonuclease RusA